MTQEISADRWLAETLSVILVLLVGILVALTVTIKVLSEIREAVKHPVTAEAKP